MEPTSTTVALGGQEIGWHVWHADDAKTTTAPLLVIFHGFLAHARYPTVRYAAEILVGHLPGATVVAADMPGHGISKGLRGYLPCGADELIHFGHAVLAKARELYDNHNKKRPIFLVGSSMGGTIAWNIALKEPAGVIAGVVLLAPMMKLNVSTLEQGALSALALLVPTWQVIPSSSTNSEKQYRDEKKRKECDNDQLTISGSKIRVGSAYTCVQLAQTATQIDDEQQLTKFPVWMGVADQDVVVDKAGSLQLHERITTAGGASTLAVYPALHGLLCEPSPLYDQIAGDLLAWVKEKI